MLTAFNAPVGECAICLGELEKSGTTGDAGLLRTPCNVLGNFLGNLLGDLLGNFLRNFLGFF